MIKSGLFNLTFFADNDETRNVTQKARALDFFAVNHQFIDSSSF